MIDCKDDLGNKLNEAPHLRNPVLSILTQLVISLGQGKTLYLLFSKTLSLSEGLPTSSTANLQDLFDHAVRGIEQACSLTGDTPNVTKSSPNFLPAHSIEVTLREIKNAIDGLLNLSPGIDTCHLCVDEAKPYLQDENIRRSEQSPYVSILTVQYPKASRLHIKRTADTIWQRRQKLSANNTAIDKKRKRPFRTEEDHSVCSDNDTEESLPTPSSETNTTQPSYISSSISGQENKASKLAETATSLSETGTNDCRTKEVDSREGLERKWVQTARSFELGYYHMY